MNNIKQILNTWYPIIIAFICMCYSIGLGLFGYTEEAQYSAHWAGTILLFAIAIRPVSYTHLTLPTTPYV